MNPYLAVVSAKRAAGGGGGVASPHHRSLTVDHTQVPSTQTDFPVLVKLTDATLKTVGHGGNVGNTNGYDIQFFSDSGLTTKLKWEMEFYNATAGTVVAWVKIPSLSSSSDTVFYMGYGDDTIITDQSDKVNVWTNSFVGVYHLGNGTTLSVADSLNSNNGTNHSVTATAGQIDGCGSFVSASSQYIDLGTGINPAAITFSAWVKATSYPHGYNVIMVRERATPTSSFTWMVRNGDFKMALFLTNSAGSQLNADGTGTASLTPGTWFYVNAFFNSGTGGFYVNGVLDYSTSIAALPLETTAASTWIGGHPLNTGFYWDGLIDEARVASVARSADWILAEFNNQKAASTFITMGSEV